MLPVQAKKLPSTSYEVDRLGLPFTSISPKVVWFLTTIAQLSGALSKSWFEHAQK